MTTKTKTIEITREELAQRAQNMAHEQNASGFMRVGTQVRIEPGAGRYKFWEGDWEVSMAGAPKTVHGTDIGYDTNTPTGLDVGARYLCTTILLRRLRQDGSLTTSSSRNLISVEAGEVLDGIAVGTWHVEYEPPAELCVPNRMEWDGTPERAELILADFTDDRGGRNIDDEVRVQRLIREVEYRGTPASGTMRTLRAQDGRYAIAIGERWVTVVMETEAPVAAESEPETGVGDGEWKDERGWTWRGVRDLATDSLESDETDTPDTTQSIDSVSEPKPLHVIHHVTVLGACVRGEEVMPVTLRATAVDGSEVHVAGLPEWDSLRLRLAVERALDTMGVERHGCVVEVVGYECGRTDGLELAALAAVLGAVRSATTRPREQTIYYGMLDVFGQLSPYCHGAYQVLRCAIQRELGCVVPRGSAEEWARFVGDVACEWTLVADTPHDLALNRLRAVDASYEPVSLVNMRDVGDVRLYSNIVAQVAAAVLSRSAIIVVVDGEDARNELLTLVYLVAEQVQMSDEDTHRLALERSDAGLDPARVIRGESGTHHVAPVWRVTYETRDVFAIGALARGGVLFADLHGEVSGAVLRALMVGSVNRTHATVVTMTSAHYDDKVGDRGRLPESPIRPQLAALRRIEHSDRVITTSQLRRRVALARRMSSPKGGLVLDDPLLLTDLIASE